MKLVKHMKQLVFRHWTTACPELWSRRKGRHAWWAAQSPWLSIWRQLPEHSVGMGSPEHRILLSWGDGPDSSRLRELKTWHAASVRQVGEEMVQKGGRKLKEAKNERSIFKMRGSWAWNKEQSDWSTGYSQFLTISLTHFYIPSTYQSACLHSQC